MTRLLVFLALFISFNLYSQKNALKVGIVGLTHTHVHGIFNSEKRGEIKIVGIVEPNKEVALAYTSQYKMPMSMVYNTMDEMISAVHPEAVSAFGNIYDHLAVVQKCAPLGIHIMVEKPLAVSMDHAKKMEALANKHQIVLLTNYETTWYPTNHEAQALLGQGKVGDLRKLVVRDGHRGPKHIVENKEFFEWLVDPVKNGGGALPDFGCYGANLSTWLHKGEKPISVTAVTQQLQKENHPKVEDEVTIILNYKNSNAIIQPSWNWPIGRKDMEIYGTTGVIYADNRHDLRIRMAEGYDGYKEQVMKLKERAAPFDDPFALFTAVIRKEVELDPFDLSGLPNNMMVVEILEAAKKSAKQNKTIFLKKQ